jgi:hypothetical protein
VTGDGNRKLAADSSRGESPSEWNGMAIYLKYFLKSQDATSVEYEIHTRPNDPDPATVRYSKAEDSPLPDLPEEKAIAIKALVQIRKVSRIEGEWPRGGAIMS